MTPAKAAKQRALLIEGKAHTREEEREAERKRKEGEEARQAEEQARLDAEQNEREITLSLARLKEFEP